MATYGNGSEVIFDRFEHLLNEVWRVEGSDREWRNNWAPGKLADYEQYFQLLWMLQCFEFFKRRGADVQFGMDKTAASDLIIRLTSNVSLTFYAECYVYTKWWFVESFLNDVCMCLGDDIAS
jgi:hypothetical protein